MKTYNTKKTNSWEKSGIKPKDIPKKKFIDICESSESMAHAASKLGLHYASFKKYALKYGCYKTNQQGKGIKKNIGYHKTLEQLQNSQLVKNSSLAALKKRIIKEGIFKYECKNCKLKEWKGKKLSLHLDHIDGNRKNNELNNLRFLCPNCHSQTETYCRKKTK